MSQTPLVIGPGTLQMVQPHLAFSPASRPLQPSCVFKDVPPLSTKPSQKISSAADVEAAFRADLLAMTPNLRAFALSLVGDRDRADDLVQDTLLRAIEKRDRFEPGTQLQAWLFTLMRNLFYSEYRKRKREVEDADGLFAAKLSIVPEQPGRVEFAQLRSALMRLSDDQREAVLLIGAEGFSYEEAAVICGTKVGTIKSRVNRARNRLAELLGYETDEGGPKEGKSRANAAGSELSYDTRSAERLR
jgi:RNA polymerase sigma-70 factor (ECF subfamily)